VGCEMLPEAIALISAAKSVPELEAAIARLCLVLKFTSAGYYRLTRLGAPAVPELLLGAGFEDWVQIYVDRRYAAVDPVIPVAFRRDLPFSSLEIAGDFPEPAQLHADRALYWAPDALFCPVASSMGEVGLMCWTSAEVVTMSAADRLAMSIISQAAVIQFKHLIPPDDLANLPPRPLTRREAQCAFWASEGKRVNEIAEILRLSNHTVRQYLDSAILKLSAKNRGDMLLRASALGLIADRGSAASD
jgi:DNA-binding CsgD family transcriptional regulator